MRSFNPRLSHDELRKLYRAYRDPEYQKAREQFEPWYTASFNASLEQLDVVERRRNAMRHLLSKYPDFQPKRVLDFGGNRGELVHDLIPEARSFVYDISANETIGSVVGLTDVDACATEDCDLVVCSNVLEHVSAPRQTLDEIARAAPNALVLLEVPIESPFSFGAVVKRLIQQAILTILRPSVALKLYRLGFLLQMHEHVQYFTRDALRSLVMISGYTVVGEGAYVLNTAIGPLPLRSSLAWVLARPPRAQSLAVRDEAYLS